MQGLESQLSVGSTCSLEKGGIERLLINWWDHSEIENMYSNSASYLEVGYLKTTTINSLEAARYEKRTKHSVQVEHNE
jgi:hypothetical protein